MKDIFKKILKLEFLLKNKEILLSVFLCVFVAIANEHKIYQRVAEKKKLDEEWNKLNTYNAEIKTKLQDLNIEKKILEKVKKEGLKRSETLPEKIIFKRKIDDKARN